jgi:probable rRNA maturation factor
MRQLKVFTEGETSLPYSGITKKFILSISGKVLELTETDNVSISVILTDNQVIHEINREYRGKDKSTDVISFAYRDEPFPSPGNLVEELGDVYISLEKAGEQAAEYEVDLKAEVKRLIVHGILHLLGYDHERSAEDEKIMQELEEKLITSI